MADFDFRFSFDAFFAEWAIFVTRLISTFSIDKNNA